MTAAILGWIRRHFPNLRTGGYAITSEDTDEYNCIAWAAGDTDRWWWPVNSSDAYWPPQLPRVTTKENFFDAFRLLNYELCDDGSLEIGFEKVAIYIGADDEPKHMARQLNSGVWSSKLGEEFDIAHETLEGVEGQVYGKVRYFMKRPLPEMQNRE